MLRVLSRPNVEIGRWASLEATFRRGTPMSLWSRRESNNSCSLGSGRERIKMPSKGGNTSAFTLVEILVVIAVLAIMTALLFPVFAAAREAARKATCISTLRQTAQARARYL